MSLEVIGYKLEERNIKLAATFVKLRPDLLG